MGYSRKKIPNTNILVDLDKTYKYLIKPVLIEEGLVSVSQSNTNSHAFRCDEIYTTQAINKTFITNLYKADIVVADITALNQNAIYELGLRHAMKPKSTIIICDENTKESNKFFDLTFIPQVFYNSKKQRDISEINKFSRILKEVIKTCLNAKADYIDSPVFTLGIYKNIPVNIPLSIEESDLKDTNLRAEINLAEKLLEKEEYKEAESILGKIIKKYSFCDIDVICSYVVSIYKNGGGHSKANLERALNTICSYIDIENTTSEDALGIYASINLKLFNLLNDPNLLYTAIEYYRRGANYESGNIYCGRNYCASLLKVHRVEYNPEIIKEYYYTAVHTAKQLLTHAPSILRKSDSFNDVWFISNQNDLMLIAGITSRPTFKVINATQRQKDTIHEGEKQLLDDLKIIKRKLKIKASAS